MFAGRRNAWEERKYEIARQFFLFEKEESMLWNSRFELLKKSLFELWLHILVNVNLCSLPCLIV